MNSIRLQRMADESGKVVTVVNRSNSESMGGGNGNLEGCDAVAPAIPCNDSPAIEAVDDITVAATMTAETVESTPVFPATPISEVGISDDDDEVQIVKFVDNKVKLVPVLLTEVSREENAALSFPANTVLKAIENVDRCLELNMQERMNLMNCRNSLQEKLKLQAEVSRLSYLDGPKSSGSSTATEEKTANWGTYRQNINSNVVFIPSRQTKWLTPPSQSAHTLSENFSSNKTGPQQEKENRTMESLIAPPQVVPRQPMTPSPATPSPKSQNPTSSISIVPIRATPRSAAESEKQILGILKRHSESLQNIISPTTSILSQNFNSPLQFLTKPKPPTPPSSSRRVPRKFRRQVQAESPSWVTTQECEDLESGQTRTKRSRNEQRDDCDYFLVEQDREAAYINATPDAESCFNDDEPSFSVASILAPEVEITDICERCRCKKADFVCTGCCNVMYCSKECQQFDWAKHASHCTNPDDQ